jgi:hypothetical protein
MPGPHRRLAPLAAALAAGLCLAAITRGAPPPSTRALADRLRAGGRAEAEIERRAHDPFRGGWVSVRGRIALEPPDRALLEFPATGERIALRGDGGEWLQPGLQQLLRLGPRNAAAGLRWWQLLLPGREARFTERALGNGRIAVVAQATGALAPDTAWVSLDARGLPSMLEYGDGEEERIQYRIRGWRFLRGRGRAAFVLSAPPAFQVVDLP